MGGDHAPEVTVAGAVRAAVHFEIPTLLVGDQAKLEPELRKHGSIPERIQIVHAPSAIQMDESPGPALLRKRDASIIVATDLVQQGKAAAVVSAGNSGAAMGAATLRLGLLPGIERPAIAMVMPNLRGGVIALDVGATVDTRAEHLVDFASIGSVYAHCLLHIERPRVALLNIGTEASKGNAVVKRTYPLLQDSNLNFVGFVEGQHIALGDADVVVCDGFVGNAILKTTEGYAELFWSMMKEAMASGPLARIGGLLLGPALRRAARRLDYASYGGALLVGVDGIFILGHGRSSPDAIANAIRSGSELAEAQAVDQLRAALHAENNEPLKAEHPASSKL